MLVLLCILFFTHFFYGDTLLYANTMQSSCCINFKEFAERANASSIFDNVLPVSSGGTGVSALTAYALLSAGATSTAPILMVGPGASTNLILASNASAASSFKQLNIQKTYYTTPGNYTYTPATGMLFVVFELVGGGGAGGGSRFGEGNVGCGGGSGGYLKVGLTAAQITAAGLVTIVVGEGGVYDDIVADGQASHLTGGYIANGGSNGAISTTSNINGGGVGGSASGIGAIGLNGFDGQGTSGALIEGSLSGQGAHSLFGQGGYSVLKPSSGSVDGNPGQGYGSGGSGGAAEDLSEDSFAGGEGASGIAIVTEYILS